MARNRNRKAGRDVSALQSPSLTRPSLVLPPLSVTPVDLRQFEDRRTYHPEGPLRRPFSLQSASRQIVAKPSKPYRSPWASLRFNVPEDVALCVRRSRRREVLFALNKSGRNGMRRSRRNAYSQISCKRRK